MPDTIAVMISSPGVEAVSTALDLAVAAASVEMGAHLYFSGAAVIWFSSHGGAAEAVGAPTGEEREAVLARLRTAKELGDVKVYACSRAMTAHGIAREDVPPEVDHPAGLATFLSLARKALFTLNF
ncbi:MAG: DsrE family protein [Candidatus Dormibacteria bacterium]